ncbi:hypothetical protein OC846_000630 [Tilletia horrida]|uniref:Uncharacterized protein n=1 Tax=Tilletia horrida TaxID=155126 RepID=A0AAN6GVJ0_9BASI|nr:hypothetical protein OC846_000630 [Tilletia horrida]
MPNQVDEAQIPSRAVKAVTIGNIFADQLATYDRKKSRAAPSPSNRKQDKHGSSASTGMKSRWPEGLLDQLAVPAAGASSDSATDNVDAMLLDFEPPVLDNNPLSSGTQSIAERIEDNDIEYYAEALFNSRELMCVRISVAVWVLEGWKDGVPDIGSFHHLHVLRLPERLAVSCDCPSYRSKTRCIHHDLFIRAWNDLVALKPLDSAGQ